MSCTTVTGLASNDASWTSCTNNAARIQAALDGLTTPGCISIPAGTYYVAQSQPDETQDAWKNSAVFIAKGGVEVRGAGKTITILIAHNRATTVFFVGRAASFAQTACTNLTFRDLTFEGRPHVVATNTSGGTNWDSGQFLPANSDFNTGSLLVSQGININSRNINMFITNCVFRNPGNFGLNLATDSRNVFVRQCDFFAHDGSNGVAGVNMAGPAIFARSGVNLVVVENTFNGNPSMTNVNTEYSALAEDGLVWFQDGGNWFVARNAIRNYIVEAVQLNAGPGAAVGNMFDTKISL
jgi:hypothetical protein